MPLGIKNIPLLKLAFAYTLGIYLGDYFLPLDIYTVSFSIFLTGSCLLLLYLLDRHTTLKSMMLLTTVFYAGVMQMHLRNALNSSSHFSMIPESKIHLLSVLEVKNIGQKKRAICKVTYSGNSLENLHRCTGKMMVYFRPQINKPISVGSRVVCKSNYFIEKKNTNPKVFDYKKYLNYRGIYHRMHLDSSSYFILANEESTLKIKASKFRDLCNNVFSHHIRDSNALAVAAAMVLGERNLLTNELYDAFTDTGAVHVLAVSGLHVGIISWLIFQLLRFIRGRSLYSKLTKLILCLTAIWSFAFITGAAAAVTRSAIMFSLFFTAKSFDKSANPYNVLSGAALLMLFFNPNYLFQAGFQFSFLALGGIFFFYPYVKRWYMPENKFLQKIWNGVAVSISAQLLVSPLAIYYFHKLPTYFWLTGLVAIPAAFIILGLGLLLLCSSLIFGQDNLLSKLVGISFEKLLIVFNEIIFSIQKLPYCSADGLWLSTPSLILIYGALISLVLHLVLRKSIFTLALLIFTLTQSLLHNYENHHIRKERKLVVYDIYSESLIDVFYDGYLKEIYPIINDRSQITYTTFNNRISQRIIDSDKELNFQSQGSFHLIDDKLLCLYPTEEVIRKTSSKPIDLMVISKDSYSNLYKLSKNLDIKLLVLDGTIGHKKYKLIKTAQKLNIPVHVTSDDGALEYYI